MRRIVVGYDGSEHAKRALERAAELAGGGTVTVVLAVRVHLPAGGRGPGAAPVEPAEAAASEQALVEASEILRAAGARVETVGGVGDPAKAIVETAADVGADVIVVGTRGLNVAERLVLGSVSTRVVHSAPCDVLVVR